eukprot:scaffold3852_cov402-Prasinococcus_capsulatus_cf.AAC.18
MDPQTQQIFTHYFQTADTDRDGRISGGEAVAFFQRSGLAKVSGSILSSRGRCVGLMWRGLPRPANSCPTVGLCRPAATGLARLEPVLRRT